jgi:hypothetical protein
MSTGLESPRFSAENSTELSQFLDQNMRHHEVLEGELDAKCPKVVADYYRLLCKISTQDSATKIDYDELDKLTRQFESSQALFYNPDVVGERASLEQRLEPAWYEQELKHIKSEFERDKVYREYRYIANTRFLTDFHNRERPAMESQVGQLVHTIDEFVGSPPWRVYKKYQETVEKLLPEGPATD